MKEIKKGTMVEVKIVWFGEQITKVGKIEEFGNVDDSMCKVEIDGNIYKVYKEECKPVKRTVNKGEREYTNPQIKTIIDETVKGLDKEDLKRVEITIDASYSGNDELFDVNLNIKMNYDFEDFLIIGLADEEYCIKEAQRTVKYLSKYFPQLNIRYGYYS